MFTTTASRRSLVLACVLFAVWNARVEVSAQTSIPGDANLDGRFGSADVEATVQAILEQTSAPGDSDCTSDHAVDVRDVVCIENLIVASVPEIVSFAPTTVRPGDLVTVAGSFLTLPDGRPVSLRLRRQGGGELEAPVTTATPTALTLVVPPGASTGPLTAVAPERPVATSAEDLVVLPAADFQLSAAPGSATLIQGQSIAFAVSLTSSNGFSQLATLSVSGLPAGVVASFTPPSMTAGQRSILTLTADPKAPAGPASLILGAVATVVGVALSDTAEVALTVVAPSTTFLGRTVVADRPQTPLAGVTVTALGVDGSGNATGCVGQAVSDAAGNFALTDLPPSCAGGQLIRYDGVTVTSPPGTYAGVDLYYELALGQVTVSPILVHLPRIDDAGTALVVQNAPVDQHFTFAGIRDLSITVYAGATLQRKDGSMPDPFPLVAVDVPVDRLPDEMPPVPGEVGAFIVAFQPANATASQPIAVTFPNLLATTPGTAVTLTTLDPTQGVMVTYGTGVISPDGRQVIPDLDPAYPGHRYGIVHFDWHGPMQPPPERNPQPPCSGVSGVGKPIDPTTGIEILTETDLRVAGPRGGLELRRTYRTLAPQAGPFGIGTTHGYGHRLGSSNPWLLQVVMLILPGGQQIPFARDPDGLMRNGTVPTFAGATLETPAAADAVLHFKDGTTFVFKPRSPALGSTLESITDRFGNRTRLIRDPARPVRITAIEDPVGRRITLSYDGTDRITTATDPIGRMVTYAYNAQGMLASVTDAAGGVTLYGYDAMSRLTTVTDARGVVVAQNTYDANDRAIRQIQADGGTWDFDYTLANPLAADSPVLRTRVTDPRGFVTTYRFNPQGYLLSVTDALGQTRTLEREQGTNRLLAIRGTADCSVCGTSPASAGDRELEYDAVGNVTRVTDALGRSTLLGYEPDFQQLESRTDALGHTTSYAYDTLGQQISSTDALGRTTLFDYDGTGLLTSVTDPLGHALLIDHDGFGNPVALTDPLGATTRRVFDAVGRVVEAIDPLGRRTFYGYDALDRLVSVIDPAGGTVVLAYDAVGNLLSLTDPRGKTTSYTYDGMNRPISRTDSLGATTTWERDLLGNVTRVVDRRGEEGIFTYDPLNRLVLEQYSDSVVRRTYDARGRVVLVDDTLGGSFTFEHDGVGDLMRSAGPVGGVEYGRDALGRVTRRQVVGLSAQDSTYDEVGDLVLVSSPHAWVSFEYDAHRQLVRRERSNGVVSDHVYDPAGRLLSLVHSLGGTPLVDQGYAYDATGRRVSLASSIEQPLTTAASTRSIDPLSNRLLQSGGTTYAYDGEGSRESASSPAGTMLYTWDARGRLVSVAEPDGVMLDMRYDPEGNLVTLTRSGVGDPEVTAFVVDESTNLAALSQDGQPWEILAGIALDEHLGMVGPGAQVLLGLDDGLGSTVGLANGAGDLVDTYAYEPFGERSAGDLGYPFQFTGRVPIEGGLYYHRARYFDPGAARFLSEDPLGFGGGDANLYRYVFNDPVNLTDPTGQISPQVVIGTVVGACIALYVGYHQYVKPVQETIDTVSAAQEFGESVNRTSNADQACLLGLGNDPNKPAPNEQEQIAACYKRGGLYLEQAKAGGNLVNELSPYSDLFEPFFQKR